MADEDLLRQAVDTAWSVYRATHNEVHGSDERRCLLERHLQQRWKAGENDAEELTCAGLALSRTTSQRGRIGRLPQRLSFDAWVTQEPRCSRIGPSPTFAIIAAPSRSAANVNATRSRHMPPSRFRIRSGSDAPVYNCRVSQTHDRPRARVIWINALEEEEPRRPGSP